jgi:hypothetical protein
MTPDDRWIDRARFDAEHADRVWAGSADIEDAPAWYGRVATLIRDAAAPSTDDELAGESDIVARMQAAILEPAEDDELAGESGIVARMQATILDLRPAAGSDGVGDADRPRHLRAAAGGRDGARRRQGARVVRRIVAVKAAAVTTVVAIGVTAAAATTGIVATVVVPALSSHDAKELKPPEAQRAADSETSAESSGGIDDGDGGDAPSVTGITLESGKPLACMFQLDCLMKQVEKATGVPAGTTPPDAALPGAEGAPTSTVVDPNAAVPPPPEPPPVTPPSEPPTDPPPDPTTTTEPPTTTTTEPPTTTTTTEPPPQAEMAAPPPAEPLAAQTGETGGAPDATAAGLTVGAGGGAGAGTEAPPAG